MTIERDIEVLNDLIMATLDSAEAYRQAADRACGAKFKRLFAERVAERRAIADLLQRQVRALGGEPEGHGHRLAGLHRSMLELKDRLMGFGDRVIIREVESEEDQVKTAYEEALREDLSPELRRAVEQHYARIKAGHDEVSAMKEARRRARAS